MHRGIYIVLSILIIIEAQLGGLLLLELVAAQNNITDFVINETGKEVINCVDGDIRACGSNIGLCQSGTRTCSNSIWGECFGGIDPLEETCNGLDDNCNGIVDDGIVCECTDGETKSCGSNIGVCEAGTRSCSNGTWSECSGGIDPFQETCNLLDDNCNGMLDDGDLCSEGQSCIEGECITSAECIDGETRLCGSNVGVCEAGTRVCVNGVWGDCVVGVGPEEEICDGLDNNCDSVVDEVCLIPEIKKIKNDFKLTEQPEFEADVRPVKIELYDSVGNLVDVEFDVQERAGKFYIKIINKREFKAGLYKLKTELVSGGVAYSDEQDFTWGVLVVNTHKSIYLPNENAFIAIGVLDDEGRIVCDADVTLSITDPDGIEIILTTANREIIISDECNFYGVTNLPDYYTNYQIGGVGIYQINLKAVTFNGERAITDSFIVEQLPDFDVARNGPTRIYPVVPYTMNFTIKANKNHNGPIREFVPASFSITPQENLFITIVGDTKVLEWNININSGETVILSYEFDAPDISPGIFVLGPLEIGSWEEKRNWLIASDIITAYQFENYPDGSCSKATYSTYIVTRLLASPWPICIRNADKIKLTSAVAIDLLLGYLDNGGYGVNTIVTGQATGNDINLKSKNAPATCYISLVEVNPSTQTILSTLDIMTVSCPANANVIVNDISQLSGIVPAGSTFGILLSITPTASSQLEVSWGAYGATRKQELINVDETAAPLNAPPTITSVTDSPDPVTEGSDVTFTLDWDDLDVGELIRIHICQTDAIDGASQSCPGGSWCDSAGFTAVDPESCSYTTGVADIGTNSYFAFVCDDSNDCSSSSSSTFTVDTAPDLEPPYWFNNISTTPAVYSPIFISNFDISWLDNIAVDTVYIEGNWSGSDENFSTTQAGANYNYNTNLPAGTFYWMSWGNDTSDNLNVTDKWIFTVAKASSSCLLTILPPTPSVYDPTPSVTATGSCDNPEVTEV